MDRPVPFSLIIPAHNEEAVIGRCLETALRDAPETAEIDVIVAANGCGDRTAEMARKAAPNALVLELPVGSKTAAINAANSEASFFPRIYLDADIECEFASLAALARTVCEPGIMTAAPAIQLELSHCNAFVRSYYAAWMQQPFAKAGKGGAGCYALSEAAIQNVGEFPEIIGDDIWIHTRFADDQKRMVSQDRDGNPVFSRVRPPRSAREQVKVEARRMIGNREVRQKFPSVHFENTSKSGGFRASLKSGASMIDLATFYAIKFLVRAEMKISAWRGEDRVWSRDLSSRQTEVVDR